MILLKIGPSYTTDATWIGGSQAIMRAKRMIEDGEINAAIIGSCSLCLNPNISLQLEGLGRLTNTNETRSYSEDGILILIYFIHTLNIADI
jgi:3-oxoacyl-(acyl-carrier-protein) synthase